MSAPKLSHLIHEPGDRRTICGAFTATVPTTWMKNAIDHPTFESEHGRPWPLVPCATCYRLAGLDALLPLAPLSLFDSPVSVEDTRAL